MRFLRFLFWATVIVGAIIGVLRLTALRWWQVPTDDPLLEASVTPTLAGGDWVLLWRATPPRYGSLVLCPDPQEAGRVIIGRVLGEDGDTVSIDGARVTVNNRDVPTERRCSEATFQLRDPSTGEAVIQHCDMEAAGGVAHLRGTLENLNRRPVGTTRQVSEGQFFLVSDNRGYPFDSRHYGAVERRTCKEWIFFRLVSKNGFPDEKQRFTYIR
jgi:signal peptidase I